MKEWYQRNPERYRENARRYQRELSPEKKAKRKLDQEARSIVKRQYVLDYLLQHPCECGESDPVCLQFHHRDPSEKYKAVGDLLGAAYGLETVKAEITKCNVLCANCHLKLHAREKGFFKSVRNS